MIPGTGGRFTALIAVSLESGGMLTREAQPSIVVDVHMMMSAMRFVILFGIANIMLSSMMGFGWFADRVGRAAFFCGGRVYAW